MTISELKQYLPVLLQRPFALFPEPAGIDPSNNRFTLLDYDPTHVRLQNVNTQVEYLLPLVLVEFANPGVLRLMRAVRAFNGSFI